MNKGGEKLNRRQLQQIEESLQKATLRIELDACRDELLESAKTTLFDFPNHEKLAEEAVDLIISRLRRM